MGEAPAQRLDDVLGVVHAQRRLRDIGEPLRICGLECFGVLHRLDQRHRPRLDLSHRADDLRVALMPDQQCMQSVACMALRLGMHLGDQRAGGVDIRHLPPRRLRRHHLRHAMRGEHHRAVIRALGQLLDKDRAHRLKPLHHMRIVHDLVAHIDRRAPFGQRLLHDLDRAIDPGAEPTGRGQEDEQGWFRHASQGIGEKGSVNE